jgi:CBS domain containing-hemolysin-like protein
METGVISIHRMRLRHLIKQGSRPANLLLGFLEESDRLLGTTLVGTNFCVVILSVVSAGIAVRLVGAWGEPLATVTVAVVTMVFGEYLPKTWFHARPIERCTRFVQTLQFSEIIFRPVSRVVIWLTRGLVPGPSETFSEPVPFVTREDLKILAREGEKDGVLSPRERVMIHRVFELSGKTARQIMTPLAQVTYVNRNLPISGFFAVARSSRLTRIPVYDPEQKQFVGIINVFHVLSSGADLRGKTVADFIRPPLFISAQMSVDDILPRLRRSRQPMCLVRDTENRVIGLVTTEDILQEIVGRL